MTISSTTRKAGPYAGNDVAVSFPFAFKVFAASDVLVVFTSAANVETILTLTTNYTVTLNSNQDTNPGGTVTLLTALATGEKLTLSSAVANLQPVDLTNNGGFYPAVINKALDRATIQIQQLSEKVGRALVWPISATGATLPAPEAGKFIGWNDTDDSLVNLAGIGVGDAQNVASNDGASGTLWTTVAGFISRLMSSVGSSVVGFIQAGIGAVTRTAQDKMRESVSVLDFGAVGDGVADDTAFLNLSASVARTLGKVLFIPAGEYKISSSVDFSGLTVCGEGYTSIIKATSAQFNVITTTGQSTFRDFQVHGGWDGVTSGQTGHGIYCFKASPDYPYVIHMDNVRVQYSKECGIYIARGGYSSLRNIKCNASGLHGIELYAASGSDAITTISIDGTSVFSDCPFGYGIKITNGINISVAGAILEWTKGIELAGNDNRNIVFTSVYQENTFGSTNFITLTGAGIGLIVSGCYGALTVGIPYSANWFNVYVYGNAGFIYEAALSGNGALIAADGGEQTTTTATSLTAAQISIPPGTWIIQAFVQTQNAGGAVMDYIGTRLTHNDTDPGISVDTNANFVVDANAQIGIAVQTRSRVDSIYQNTGVSNQTVYLRTFMNVTAGTVAYRGYIKAVKVL